MKNIKVGEYARHIKDGYIGKIVDFDDIFVKLDIGRSALRHYIKTAENLIDLIKEGDYVNGKKIEQIIINNYIGKMLFYDIDYPIQHGLRYFTEYDVKTVVTKEAFAQMEYKVGE